MARCTRGPINNLVERYDAIWSKVWSKSLQAISEGQLIDIRAEPLYYGRRLTDAVWLNRQIWQSYIPYHAPGHFHQMAGFRSSLPYQPSPLSTIRVFCRHRHLDRSFLILSSTITNPHLVDCPTPIVIKLQRHDHYGSLPTHYV